MKGPITALEARWKLAGLDPVSGYSYQTFPLGVPVNIKDGLTPGAEYEIGLRYLGPVPSGWTVFNHTVAATTRQGLRAFPAGASGNVSSRWLSGDLTWDATDTLATIDFTAAQLKVGDDTVDYGASSAQVSGTALETKTVHVYYDDRDYAGGTRTLGVSEDINDTVGHGKAYIADLAITFDSAGGTGTGGGGGISGGGGGSGQFEP